MRKRLQILLGVSKKEKCLLTAELIYNSVYGTAEFNYDTHNFIKYYEDDSEEMEIMRSNYLNDYPVDFSDCHSLWEVKDKIRSIEDNFAFYNDFFELVDCSCSGDVILRIFLDDYALESRGCGSSFADILKDDDFVFLHDKIKEGLDVINTKYTPLIKSEEDLEKYKEEINKLFKFDNLKFSCIGGFVCMECKEDLEMALEKLDEKYRGLMDSITEPTPYLD